MSRWSAKGGHSRRSDGRLTTSDLPPETDIAQCGRHVLKVPTAVVPASPLNGWAGPNSALEMIFPAHLERVRYGFTSLILHFPAVVFLASCDYKLLSAQPGRIMARSG
jgi:hypothetical protein